MAESLKILSKISKNSETKERLKKNLNYIRLYENGFSMQSICEHYSIALATLEKIIGNEKTYKKRATTLNSSCVNKKLERFPLEKKLEIIQMHENNCSIADISKNYDILESSVRCILKHKDYIKFSSDQLQRMELSFSIETQLQSWFAKESNKGHLVDFKKFNLQANIIYASLTGKGHTDPFVADSKFYNLCKERYGINTIHLKNDSLNKKSENGKQAKYTLEYKLEYIRLYEKGYSIDSICRYYFLTQKFLKKIIRKAKVYKQRATGIKLGKMKNGTQLEIIQMNEEGCSVQTIAECFSVSQSFVRHILNCADEIKFPLKHSGDIEINIAVETDLQSWFVDESRKGNQVSFEKFKSQADNIYTRLTAETLTTDPYVTNVEFYNLCKDRYCMSMFDVSNSKEGGKDTVEKRKHTLAMRLEYIRLYEKGYLLNSICKHCNISCKFLKKIVRNAKQYKQRAGKCIKADGLMNGKNYVLMFIITQIYEDGCSVQALAECFDLPESTVRHILSHVEMKFPSEQSRKMEKVLEANIELNIEVETLLQSWFAAEFKKGNKVNFKEFKQQAQNIYNKVTKSSPTAEHFSLNRNFYSVCNKINIHDEITFANKDTNEAKTVVSKKKPSNKKKKIKIVKRNVKSHLKYEIESKLQTWFGSECKKGNVIDFKTFEHQAEKIYKDVTAYYPTKIQYSVLPEFYHFCIQRYDSGIWDANCDRESYNAEMDLSDSEYMDTIGNCRSVYSTGDSVNDNGKRNFDFIGTTDEVANGVSEKDMSENPVHAYERSVHLGKRKCDRNVDGSSVKHLKMDNTECINESTVSTECDISCDAVCPNNKSMDIDINEQNNSFTDDSFEKHFRETIERGKYSPCQIFSVNSTCLFLKHLPIEGINSNLSRRDFLDQVTVLLGCNATADFRLKPLVVSLLENPLALQGFPKQKLPVLWKSNKSGLISEIEFCDWFTSYFCPAVEEYCGKNSLENKALLVLKTDTILCHPLDDLSSNVKVVYLPVSSPTILHPMNNQIMNIFKANYHLTILSEISMLCEVSDFKSFEKIWSSYNIKMAVNNIAKAWNRIKVNSLNRAWIQLFPTCIFDLFVSEDSIESIFEEIMSVSKELNVKNISKNHYQQELDFGTEETYREWHEINRQCADDSDGLIAVKHLSLTVLGEAFKNIETSLNMFLQNDPDSERSMSVCDSVRRAISCYRQLYKEKLPQNLSHMSPNINQVLSSKADVSNSSYSNELDLSGAPRTSSVIPSVVGFTHASPNKNLALSLNADVFNSSYSNELELSDVPKTSSVISPIVRLRRLNLNVK